MMDFSYESYEKLIFLLQKNQYKFCSYHSCNEEGRVVIIRHDIDQSIEKALEMAILENKMGIKSTYFVMISSDFYNVASKKNMNMLKKIFELGHDIGLHFDEVKYDDSINIEKQILNETLILKLILEVPIRSFSMHRPSEKVLKKNYEFRELINSYDHKFFKEFKYISDSRMFWRENIFSLVEKRKYNKIHILTHPFCYDFYSRDMKSIQKEFCKQAVKERYMTLTDNITELNSILMLEEVLSP